MNYRFRKIGGWILFGICIACFLSIIIKFLLGRYYSGGPEYTVVMCLILAGIAVVSWKLAHSKKREKQI